VRDGTGNFQHGLIVNDLLFHGLPPLVIAFGARYLNRFLHETEHYYDNRYKIGGNDGTAISI
jgi:hypothetical protein